MSFDGFFHGVTTIISADAKNKSFTGTGFFFSHFGDLNRDEFKKVQPKIRHADKWHDIKSIWLVSNRHVILSKIGNIENFPDKIAFRLRICKNNKVNWLPVDIPGSELVDRLLLHKNKDIDVACVRVGDLIIEHSLQPQNMIECGADSRNSTVMFTGINPFHLPKQENVQVNVADDIISVGYPKGYYDEYTKYPIIKSGILASPWRLPYEGKPCFLIDCKLFSGSSGSLILSKPSYLRRTNEGFISTENEGFVFLGVYSADLNTIRKYDFETLTIIEKNPYNLGIVWNSDLVPDIIENGIKHT